VKCTKVIQCENLVKVCVCVCVCVCVYLYVPIRIFSLRVGLKVFVTV
jgi:hypothetical protein